MAGNVGCLAVGPCHSTVQPFTTGICSEVSIGTDDIEIEKDQSYKFEEYLCFYCDTIIRHMEELEVHKRSCHETVIALGDSHICDKCGQNCMKVR